MCLSKKGPRREHFPTGNHFLSTIFLILSRFRTERRFFYGVVALFPNIIINIPLINGELNKSMNHEYFQELIFQNSPVRVPRLNRRDKIGRASCRERV